MSSQLDILALEPFYGGVRKSMLETLIRCSRHRWTVLKLPPRRMERRLSVASHWFSEQVSHHWSGRVDLLYTSEAMNLADFFNLTPKLAKKPSVVYFHDNQLPDPMSASTLDVHELANLSTGMAATELWFNSMFHIKTFTHRATKLVEKHHELSSRNPLPELIRKFRLMSPPLDLQVADHIQQGPAPVKRDPRGIFVDTRNADMELLNGGLDTLRRRAVKYNLFALGPVDFLNSDIPRTVVPEADDIQQMEAMLRCEIYLSAQLCATSDCEALRAMSARCFPVLPSSGVYREMISEKVYPRYFYELEPDSLASRVQDAIHLEAPDGSDVAMDRAMKPFDAITACKAIDERIEELVIGHKQIPLASPGGYAVP